MSAGSEETNTLNRGDARSSMTLADRVLAQPGLARDFVTVAATKRVKATLCFTLNLKGESKNDRHFFTL